MRPRLALSSVFCLLLAWGAAVATRAADTASEVQKARAFASKQDYQSARTVLEKAIEGGARDVAVQELLGFCLMKLFLFDEAVEAFAKGDAGDRYHDVNLGFCLRKGGRLVEALAAFKRAQPALGPQDSWSAYCVDQIAELEPIQRARAVLCFGQADDFCVAAVNGKTVGRARAGGEAAIVLDPHLKAGQNVVHALAVNTQGPWAYRFRLYIGGKLVSSAGAGYTAKGRGAFENDETVGIVGDVTFAVSAAPEEGPRLRKAENALEFAEVRPRMLEAEELWEKGRYPDAIRIYESEAKKYPSLDWFHRRLAEACEELSIAMQDATTEAAAKRERLRKAAAAARERWLGVRKRVAQLAVDDAGAWFALGKCYAQVGKFADAEGAFEQALKHDPNRVEAMVELANSLVKQGKGEAARPIAELAIDKAPHWSYAHCMLGDAFLAAGDVQGSLNAYFRAIDLDPTQGEWMYGKVALAMNKGGANAAAIKEAAKAVVQNRSNSKAHEMLGVELTRGLRYEEALRAYQTGLAMAPGDPGVSPLMGLCYELSGRRDSAIQAYERSVEDKDEELAQLARRRLARMKLFAAPPEPAPIEGGEKDIEQAAGEGKDAAIAQLATLKTLRPVLAAGLRALPPLRDGQIGAEEAQAISRIQKLAQFARAKDDLKRGFQLIEREVGTRKGPPVIDGDLSEWSPAERLAQDPPGDALRGAPAGADLAAAYAVVSEDWLYCGFKVHGAARVAANCSYWMVFNVPGKRDKARIAIGIAADDVYVLRHAPDGSQEAFKGGRSGIHWEGGPGGIEARVPMRWFEGARRLEAEAYTWSGSQKLDVAADGRAPVRIDDGWSPSLLALFNLARAMPLESDDRPALAIAITSGDWYALNDQALARLVEDDDRRMLRFARTLKVWQKASGLPALDSIPLGQLLFWANRSVQWRGTDALDYRRDCVSPATLEAMFRFAQKKAWRGRTPGDVVEQAEKFLIDPKRWQYTSYEMVTRGVRARAGESVNLSDDEKKDLNKFVRDVHIDGKKVNTDGTFNPDLQFDYLLATDRLLGHCGNLAQTTVDFARAVGVPATIVQGREEQSKLYPNPHAFPIYYDGAARVWKSFQGRKYKGIRNLTLFFFLPPPQPPELARATGGGSFWFPIRTTYDETGPLFQNGFEADFVKAWMQGLTSGK